jgi:gas vesicle protein
MDIQDLLDLVNKQKRSRERASTVQKIAIGLGIVAALGVTAGIYIAVKLRKEPNNNMENKALSTVEDIKDNVQHTAKAVSRAAGHAAKEASGVIKDIQGKTEDLQEEVSDGLHEIKKDTDKAISNIANVLNPSKK